MPFLIVRHMSSRFSTGYNSFIDDFDFFWPIILAVNIIFLVLNPVLLCCFSVGWMRAITRGVSYKNYCSLRDEWKLVLCCIAQMLGIYICLYFVSIPFIFFSFFTVSGLSFEAAWAVQLVFFMLLLTLPFYFLAHLFLYFPAKANGHVISSKSGWRLFRGLRFQFLLSVVFALLPFAVLIFAYFIGIGFVRAPIGIMGFYVFNVLLVFGIVLINFLMTLVFCGVLSGYYLWIRKHRMKSERPQTKVPDDPFSDEGWEGPMWEDVR